MREKEKPILFSTPMVKAILEGKKTQTRRVIKPRYKADEAGFNVLTNQSTGERWVEKYDEETGSFDPERIVMPPYKPGDILWVRETHIRIKKPKNDLPLGKENIKAGWQTHGDSDYLYKADCEYYPDDKWRPSIHMPREAARLFLEVKSVRVERLQDISEEDAEAEGVDIEHQMQIYAEAGIKKERAVVNLHRLVFKDIWDRLNAKSGYSWESNPWVWVIEFRRI